MSRALVARAALLLQGVDTTQLPASLTQPLDVVVSGGGFRGQYFGGVMSILGPLAESGVPIVSIFTQIVHKSHSYSTYCAVSLKHQACFTLLYGAI